MSESYLINDMFTGKTIQQLPAAFFDGPSDAFISGWDAGMNGDPETPPPGLLPSEIADWQEGYELAKRD